MAYSYSLTFGPLHAKMCLLTYADSEGPDQFVHLHSLIRASTIHLQNHCVLQNVQMETANVQDDQNLLILCMFDGTFSLHVAHFQVDLTLMYLFCQ